MQNPAQSNHTTVHINFTILAATNCTTYIGQYFVFFSSVIYHSTQKCSAQYASFLPAASYFCSFNLFQQRWKCCPYSYFTADVVELTTYSDVSYLHFSSKIFWILRDVSTSGFFFFVSCVSVNIWFGATQRTQTFQQRLAWSDHGEVHLTYLSILKSPAGGSLTFLVKEDLQTYSATRGTREK